MLLHNYVLKNKSGKQYGNGVYFTLVTSNSRIGKYRTVVE